MAIPSIQSMESFHPPLPLPLPPPLTTHHSPPSPPLKGFGDWLTFWVMAGWLAGWSAGGFAGRAPYYPRQLVPSFFLSFSLQYSVVACTFVFRRLRACISSATRASHVSFHYEKKRWAIKGRKGKESVRKKTARPRQMQNVHSDGSLTNAGGEVSLTYGVK